VNRQYGDEKSKYVVVFDPQPTGHVILCMRIRPYIAGVTYARNFAGVAYISSLTTPILNKVSPNVAVPISGVGWGGVGLLRRKPFFLNSVYLARYD